MRPRLRAWSTAAASPSASRSSRSTVSRFTSFVPSTPTGIPSPTRPPPGQLQPPLAPPRALRARVDTHVAGPGPDFFHARPAKQRAQPREQLPDAKRLGDVVVSARVEADDRIDLLHPRGQHQNREI